MDSRLARGMFATSALNGAAQALLLALLLNCATVPAAAQDAGARDLAQNEHNLLADWKRRQRALRSVYWRIEGTRLSPRGSCNVAAVEPGEIPDRDYPAEDHRASLVCEVWIDFDDNRIRHELRGEIFDSHYGEFLAVHKVGLCDGIEIQEFVPVDGNPRPGVELRVELYERGEGGSGFFFNHAIIPILNAHGVLHDLRPIPLRKPPSLDGFQVAEELTGREGETLLRLSRKKNRMVEEWIIDRDHTAALVQRNTYYAGVLRARYDVQYGEADPVSMPTGWTLTKWDQGKVLQKDELRVVEYVANPSLEPVAFHIEPEPGMAISETASRRSFVIGGPGEPNLPLAAYAARQNRETWPLWWRISCLLMAVTVVVVALRSLMSRTNR